MLKNFMKTGQTEPYTFSIYIGLFAGLFISVLRFFAHYLHFTTFDNSFLIYDWFVHLSDSPLLVEILGAISFILFSIACALLYMLLFRTKQGVFWGIAFGITVWLALFIVLPAAIKWPTYGIVWELETQLFEICLFIVWGLFIGYSIAFEFTDEASHEPIYIK